MANYIPVSAAAADGTDFTLAANAATTLSLSAASALVPGCGALIQIKSAGGSYQTIGRLDRDYPVRVLQATGTFRVSKGSNPDLPFGVERD
ncbi:hypothetical protein QTI51_09645 [Variovorax sp. J22G73]|uniref:hypothetical protein n=1 Tax=unclassified Variovorax TaxID=663243 RepID=UPI0025789770|nr:MULTISPECIES: hypothetical protein [unclassified Variovorax]MDM0006437.1 hypothetical protein [Variovorax sp. J22R203]MDM0097540.1 hypothetical protein [Variovorax sp. J22G73]